MKLKHLHKANSKGRLPKILDFHTPALQIHDLVSSLCYWLFVIPYVPVTGDRYQKFRLLPRKTWRYGFHLVVLFCLGVNLLVDFVFLIIHLRQYGVDAAACLHSLHVLCHFLAVFFTAVPNSYQSSSAVLLLNETGDIIRIWEKNFPQSRRIGFDHDIYFQSICFVTWGMMIVDVFFETLLFVLAPDLPLFFFTRLTVLYPLRFLFGDCRIVNWVYMAVGPPLEIAYFIFVMLGSIHIALIIFMALVQRKRCLNLIRDANPTLSRKLLNYLHLYNKLCNEWLQAYILPAATASFIIFLGIFIYFTVYSLTTGKEFTLYTWVLPPVMSFFISLLATVTYASIHNVTRTSDHIISDQVWQRRAPTRRRPLLQKSWRAVRPLEIYVSSFGPAGFQTGVTVINTAVTLVVLLLSL